MQIVGDLQNVLGEIADGIFAPVFRLLLETTTDILGFRHGAQQLVLELQDLGFQFDLARAGRCGRFRRRRLRDGLEVGRLWRGVGGLGLFLNHGVPYVCHPIRRPITLAV